jgi:SNF2 family DNA or RNA helicase
LWSELKKKIILVVPASLRKQWKSELDEKFYLPSEILDGKTYKQFRRKGIKNPFDQNKIIITSYQFAARHEIDIVKVKWNVVVIDEAHNLRNVYKNPTGMAAAIQRIFQNNKKILLTATPLQNKLMELFGLISFIDTYTF